MMKRILLVPVFLMFGAVSAYADAQLTVALDRLRISDTIEMMRVEGFDYAQSLDRDMLDGQGGALWQAQVQDIYDPNRMMETLRAGFEGVSERHLRQINLFFGSDVGTRVVDLELAGREAMMQREIEELARGAYEKALDTDAPALSHLHTLEDTGDMIERNVTGALTANYRFYRGMVDGGAFVLSDEEMLAEAWGQEGEIRQDTTSWLMGYLMLSYQPLSDDELATYVQFSKTDAGRALNAAIFQGFNAMYADISYALGRAVALNMAGSDL